MKMKYLFLIGISLTALPMTAQETYEDTKLVENDLNGTARYVGMGGAMDALGADLSTISSNPAGLGLFRRSMATLSFGMVSQQHGKNFRNGNKTNASFDQVGFVYTMRENRNSFLNIGFNYHKSRNFDYILSAAGGLKDASQNTQSFLKGIAGGDKDTQSKFNIANDHGNLKGVDPRTSQLDNLYYNAFLANSNGQLARNTANAYVMNRANTGYIGEYDFNISGNINDRIYLGVTFGLHDVHYKGVSEYAENLLNYKNENVGTVAINDERRITGTGFNVKIGAIFRPIESSPFRIGLSIATPTWYSLTTQNYTYLVNGTQYQGYNPNYTTGASYDFKLYTPWKFGVSLGHTVGKYLALGASYEYADYGSMDNRINDGTHYSYFYDEYYEASHSDRAMNDHTKETLKGVSTFKIGAEVKASPEFAIRLGYNYLSPMFNKNGFKNSLVDSYGTNYSSATDYTNWKATNRLTLGLGYAVKNFSVDLAYQYSVTKGDFYPFMDSYGDFWSLNTQDNEIKKEEINNNANAVSVNNKRHQLLLTLGYRF